MRVCSRFQEAYDRMQNLSVDHSVGIVNAWGVDECTEAAIMCGPVIDTHVRRMSRDTISDPDRLVASNELDELFVK
jgi:hypothetical protein